MAMNELQRPTKDRFYGRIQSMVSTIDRVIQNDIEGFNEILALFTAAELDTMGVPASGSDNGLRDDLADLRTGLVELLQFYNGDSITPSVNLSAVADRLRHL